ncbi:MAG: rane transport protein [Candidatus Saccharibacteria bacterium]|nr:rane transport protein [Candidatus Saccharibacteria bacterium]
MGKSLHKLGSFAFTHPIWVITVWIVILGALGYLASVNIQSTSSAISIPGTEGQKALDEMAKLFPSAGKGTGRIVFAAEDGKTIADYSDVIKDSTTKFLKIDGVSGVVDPTVNTAAVSSDKKIAYTQLQLKNSGGQITESTINQVQQVVNDTRSSGMEVEMGGDIIPKNPSDILGLGEIGGLVVALIVLAATLSSLIAAGMPLITALIGVAISMAGLFSLSRLIDISSTTPVLAVMLGLAVGIDYSLFIINRYRTYVLEGFSLHTAASRAIGTAGNAVVFAAATVIIALSALSVVQIPFMTSMGLAAAGAIAVAAAVALTITPALLRLLKSRIFSHKQRAVALAAQKKKHAREVHHANRSTFWYKWGATLTKHPVVVLVLGVIVIGVISLPALDLKLGLPTDEYAAKSSTARKGYDLLAKGFGAGFNAPLIVVVQGLPAVSDADKAAVRDPAQAQLDAKIATATAQAQAAFTQQAAAAKTPADKAALQQAIAAATISAAQQKAAAEAQIDQAVSQYAKLIELKKVADRVSANETIKASQPALATSDGTAGLIEIIPNSGPSDQATIDLINNLRDSANRQKLTGSNSIELAITGSTALQTDVNAKLASVLPIYLAVVVGLSFIILVIAFRSILVPVKATVGFLLSVIAMFGSLVAVFQWGWFGVADATGPIISFLPIIAIGILFGLAMDYEFFMVTSMHEAYRETDDAQRAIHRGFAHASKVVLAAAVIMVSIFAGFISNHDPTIQAIGFGLSFGIFVDAFIVRLTLVPAAMALLDRAAWWLPKWLDRILPHVSIEGEEAK